MMVILYRNRVYSNRYLHFYFAIILAVSVGTGVGAWIVGHATEV